MYLLNNNKNKTIGIIFQINGHSSSFMVEQHSKPSLFSVIKRSAKQIQHTE